MMQQTMQEGRRIYGLMSAVLLQVLYGIHWPPQQPATITPYGDVMPMTLQEQPGPVR